MSARMSYRIIALIMALMVLISSTGLSFDMHYCQGNLQNINLFGEAMSCHEKAKKVESSHCKKKQTACHKNTDPTKTCDENNCCQNEKLTVENIDHQFTSEESEAISKIELITLIAFTQSFLLNNNICPNNPDYLNFKPPLILKDFQVVNQTFLI